MRRYMHYVPLLAALAAILPSAFGWENPSRRIGTTFMNDIAPMIIVGEGWSVQIVIQNLDPTAAVGIMRFYHRDGTPWDLPLVDHEMDHGELPLTFQGYETVVLEVPVSWDYQQLGWGRLDINCCPDLLGQVIYRKQQADRPDLMTSVPFAADMDRSTVYFDNRGWKYAGVGIVNTSPRYAWGPETTPISVTIRDLKGNEILHATRDVPKMGFDWFSLVLDYPETIGRAGTIEFITPEYGLSSFSLQFAPNGAFTNVSPADTFAPRQ